MEIEVLGGSDEDSFKLLRLALQAARILRSVHGVEAYVKPSIDLLGGEKAIRIGNFMARFDGNATCEAIVDLVLKATRSEKLSSDREAGSILHVRREPTNDSGSTATVDLPQLHSVFMQAMVNVQPA